VSTSLSQPYFAAVTLGPHQQCHFNFGQESFKYSTFKVKRKNFHFEFEKEAKKFKSNIIFDRTE